MTAGLGPLSNQEIDARIASPERLSRCADQCRDLDALPVARSITRRRRAEPDGQKLNRMPECDLDELFVLRACDRKLPEQHLAAGHGVRSRVAERHSWKPEALPCGLAEPRV